MIPNKLVRVVTSAFSISAIFCIATILSGCGGGSGGGTASRHPDSISTPTPLPIVATPSPSPTPVAGGDYFRARYPHWTTFPLRVRFDSASGVTPEIQQHLQQGMNAWKDASGGKLAYVVVNDDSANVTVGFGGVDTTLHGRCDGSWFDDGAIVNMQITLSQPSRSATPATQVQVMAHEWGHALGLIDTADPFGHSPDVADCMYPVLTPSRAANESVLTPRDKTTIRRLYGI